MHALPSAVNIGIDLTIEKILLFVIDLLMCFRSKATTQQS